VTPAPVNPVERGGIPFLCGSRLSRRPDLVHGFTTRAGGSSEGPLATLNLAARPHEPSARLVDNWTRVSAACGVPVSAVALLSQVHGADVVRIERGGGALRTLAEADAAFTTEPDVLLTVRVADCVPVLVAGDGVVGVAHAGWRGVAGGVVPALIRALRQVADVELLAVIGPCISGAAFEVGPEVVDGLAAAGLDGFVSGRSARGRPLVDLQRAVAQQLAAAGVDDVEAIPVCTATDPRMYSHRRDGAETGRSAGVIARRA
jgi:YfiH family protein